MNRQDPVEERRRRSSGEDARERLLAGLPITERWLQLAGVSTTVLEGGDGPPVILLHGGIESGGVYWAPLVSRLAERHQLVVPDAPGLGESEPVAQLDAAFDDWFAALLRLTCHERPAVVAHSLLASLTARFATWHHNTLRQLVLYGVPAIGRYRLPLGFLVDALRLDLRPSERNLDRFKRWPFLDPNRTRRQDPEWFEAFNAYMLSCGAIPHVKRTMRQLMRTGRRPIPDAELQRIGVPTALLWGRHDRMTPLRIAEAAHSKFGWPLHVIEEAGHVPHLEQPEAFLGALSAALGTPAVRAETSFHLGQQPVRRTP